MFPRFREWESFATMIGTAFIEPVFCTLSCVRYKFGTILLVSKVLKTKCFGYTTIVFPIGPNVCFNSVISSPQSLSAELLLLVVSADPFLESFSCTLAFSSIKSSFHPSIEQSSVTWSSQFPERKISRPVRMSMTGSRLNKTRWSHFTMSGIMDTGATWREVPMTSNRSASLISVRKSRWNRSG